MMDEYKFKIEEDFSLEKLSNGIIDILKRNSLMTNIEVLNQDKYIITATNMTQRNKYFKSLSGTICSISIYLEVNIDELRVIFADKSMKDKGFAYTMSMAIPVFFFSSTYGVIRQNEIEKDILSYIKRVVVDEEDIMKISNMTLRQRIICATPIVSLIIFLAMGYIWKMWAWGSLAFLLIPLMPIFLGEVNPEYIFPFVVGGIYIGLGFGLNAWHPAWIIFLTIPVYYILFPIRNKKPLKKKYEY